MGKRKRHKKAQEEGIRSWWFGMSISEDPEKQEAYRAACTAVFIANVNNEQPPAWVAPPLSDPTLGIASPMFYPFTH